MMMNLFRMIARNFHKPLKALAAGAVALGVLAGSAQATLFTWTNTTSGLWQDTNNWSPVGLPGVSDTTTFSSAATHTVSLTSDVVTLVIDVTVASGNSQTLTVNLGGNSLSLVQPGTGSPTALFWGDAGGGTNTVFVGSSTAVGKGLFVTNAAAQRATIGRSGMGIVNVTNGYVQVGINGVIASTLVLGNNGGPASRGILTVSGSSTIWSNIGPVSIGNAGAAFLDSLTVSNSASFYLVGGAMNVGANTTASTNSFLLDSNARFYVSSNNAAVLIGGTVGAVNNKGTVQGGAVWDNGGKALTVGNTSGTSNLLTIGDSGQLTNVSILPVLPGNFMTISNGLLQVSPGALTNNSAFFTGYGTIVGNVVFTNTGTLSLGFGTAVGTLTISNNVTLVSGSTTIVKLDKGQAGSNDLLNVVGTLAEAGTINISNVGAALVGGDTFKLLKFGSVSGSFGTINLPSLTGTLLWDTSLFGSQGIISVVLPPTITGPSDQATNVGATVVISTVVTGVPVPSLQWQKGGINVTDGANPWGSTNSGSTTATLTISNAQTNDSGSYCLIASNSGGSVTNCMTLTVSAGNSCPTITGPTDQFTIVGSNANFSASVAGIPTPTVQWQENGVNIANATNTSVTIPSVSFSQDGFVYSIIASNVVCTTTNSAVLHVVVPPLVQTQPVSLVVTQTQMACFSVLSTNGVPPPTYQWYFNNVLINGATNSGYCIASATPSNDGAYHCIVANVAGSATSSNATLTVNSTMSAMLTPSNTAVNVCYDTPLYMTFDRVPVEQFVGKISIYDSTNSTTPVDTIDTSLGLLQPRAVAGDSNGPFNLYPIIITGNTVAIYPRLDVLSSNQTYYVTVDPGTFAETNGAFFTGITSTNAWVFTTKPNGPANPNNVVVAGDGSGDFCTVQGALDSLPASNTTYTVVNIRDGTYTEFVDTRNKNNVHFRGQTRTGTVVQYLNNNNNNGGTHTRMSFKIFSNDISIENMTVANTTPQGGSQAEALMLDQPASRFILYNADVNSRQDTILANVNASQGYFYKSLIRGNFDYIWGGGNLFFTNCEMRTIPTASSYNLTAPRTDNGPNPPGWLGPDGRYASNGFSIVDCRFTIQDNTVSNITVVGSNGSPDGNAAFINNHIDPTYTHPVAAVTNQYILWEYNNSNLTDTASISLGLVVLTNGDARLVAASSATIWLYGWSPQLAPNILTNPVSLTVTAGVAATFSVAATGIPDPSYQWLKNGATISGQTSPTLTVSNAHCADAATYSVIVSNIAGIAVSTNATLTVIGSAPVASFTAVPTSGTEPLAVTFTDTSTSSSSPLSILWNFGDMSSTVTTGGATVVHTYAAGTYTVTLTASNACDISTLVSNNLITVITAFQAWQIQYFGSTTNPAAAANADPDGDGQNNLAEFLSGTNPTNSASGLHITSVTPSGSDVVITWSTAGGTTNVVQSTAGDGNGGYSTNYTDLSGLIVITGSGDTSTNYTDVGGGTNSPSRYYRVRLAP